jgi:hypothetical protein
MLAIIDEVSRSIVGAIRFIAGAVVRDPTTSLCFLVLSFHGFEPIVAAKMCQPAVVISLVISDLHTRCFGYYPMKCVEQRSVDGGSLMRY